jgi:hypothetical protein
MAFYGWDGMLHPRTAAPCQGPLRSLQGLDTYSLMRTVPEHFDGLASLVRLRGGLEKIEMKGLGALLT